MKKCASCTKDLPDAALHCVFCGAKQPPAPAVAGSVAKTVMGHASNEMIEQLKAQAAAAAARNNAASAPAPAPYTPPAAQPVPQPLRPGPVPTAGSVAPTMFVPGSGGPPGPGPGPGPAANAGNAPTMMAGPGMPGAGMGPGPGPGPSMGMGMPPGPGMGMPPGPGMGMPPGPGMGMPPGPGMGMPPGPGPMPSPAAPIPSAPHLTPTTGRAGRPIEPWRSSLRTMMIVAGAALIVAFMVPTSTEPSFLFQTIIDGEGVQKLGPLMIAAIGLLALVLAFIPMSPSPRGMIAGLLGVAGILVPTLLALSKGDFGLGQIFVLLGIVGLLTLVPGLLLRSEYRDSIMPRILVTIGALCVIVPELIPNDAGLPLVNHFKAIIDNEGAAGKVSAIFGLLPFLLALLSLLAWLPAPSSGLSFILAWVWITWLAVEHFTSLIVAGHIGDVVSASPNSALVSWVPLSAYLVLTGYGLASVFGKKLE